MTTENAGGVESAEQFVESMRLDLMSVQYRQGISDRIGERDAAIRKQALEDVIEFIDGRYQRSTDEGFRACYSLMLSYLTNFERELAYSRGIRALAAHDRGGS